MQMMLFCIIEAIHKNQNACCFLEYWCNNNRLTINTAKTKHMLIQTHSSRTENVVWREPGKCFKIQLSRCDC